MAVKVAINGFGRIGRLAFRQMFGHEGSEIVAINDLTSPDMLAYLLKYDSTQGNYSRDHKVEATEDAIIVDGKEIKIYAEADANNLPWGDLDVDVVLECTGFYTSKAKAQAHINAGAKKVVISAPAGNDLPTIVYNVNHEELTAEDDIISAASCTTNCLAPMAKGLNDFAPIVSGIMTTIHAWTGDQMALDGPQRKGDKRRSRACAVNIVPNSTGAAKAIGLVLPELNGKLIGAAQRVPTPTGSLTNLYAACAVNIVPNSTGAAKAIGLVLPELNGKLIGAAQRVPTPTGSLTNLYAVVDKVVTKDEVNAAMKAYAETISETFGYNEDEIVSTDIIGETHGSIFDATQTMCADEVNAAMKAYAETISETFGYNEDEIVSTDIIGETHGSIFDATQTMCADLGNGLGNGQTLVQVVSWYDNENSYTSQMVRTIKYFEKFVA